MDIHTIKQVVKHLRSNEILSVNDSYNQAVHGFRRADYLLVMKAINNLHGMRFNWPKTFNYVQILKEINSI